MNRDADADAADNFSFGRLIARSLGAAVLVLAVAVPFIWWTAQEHTTVALGIAVGALLVMIVVMVLVARHELRHVQAEIDRLKDKKREK
ncbi:hypothetical protein GOHSU_02_00730 [Gordonia hirsuta DSM 44140 = NBRC 16056]|uniref:Uncharacterized protein n=1 Tax=Gordonia hirsuta DSM 44140 = NBRC 16056 TaxID=1121927 RepID=L7L459_9ACTN|nr:hypothetical protein [Gordonia hirsuta]GAC55930.1 hypothetical protein GOHSU_02_00730 [Gordonia hirsuta DSM 44140 = NBRC 16056]